MGRRLPRPPRRRLRRGADLHRHPRPRLRLRLAQTRPGVAMTTVSLAGPEVAERVRAAFPDAVIEVTADSVTVPAERVAEVARFLRDDADLDGKYLNCLLGIDWLDHFDVVYVLSSLAKNHTFVLKARAGHESPVVPSV